MVLDKNGYKLNFLYRHGILLIIFSGVLLLFIIISAIYSIGNYDHDIVKSRLRAGLKPSIINIQSYVQFVALITIIGNTLVIGTFVGMVWGGMNKKKWGLGFGSFGFVVFLTNAIAFPFYSNQKSGGEFITAILNGILALVMIFGNVQVMILRNHMKQMQAKKKYQCLNKKSFVLTKMQPLLCQVLWF